MPIQLVAMHYWFTKKKEVEATMANTLVYAAGYSGCFQDANNDSLLNLLSSLEDEMDP